MCSTFAPLFDSRSVCFGNRLHFCASGGTTDLLCPVLCSIGGNFNCDNELLSGLASQCEQDGFVPENGCPLEPIVPVEPGDERIPTLLSFFNFMRKCQNEKGILRSELSVCLNNNLHLTCSRPSENLLSSRVVEECQSQSSCSCIDDQESQFCESVGCV